MNSSNSNKNDWKAAIFETQQKRMENLLRTGQASDIEFLVGNEATGKELIKAHTFVLGIGTIISPKFEGQFRINEQTDWPKDKPIEVIDIEPGAFKAMLNYLYLGNLSKINRENIADVLDAAKKYLLPDLVEKCVHLAMTTKMLDVHNVLLLKNVAKLHEEKTLLDHCWTFIDGNFAGIMETDVFLWLNQKEIGELFDRDTIDCEELALFKGLDRWAHKQCQDHKIEYPNGKQIRATMGPALNAIRFSLINREDFAREIVSTNILTKEEIEAISNEANVNANLPMPLYLIKRHRIRIPRNNKWNGEDCSPDLAISENGLVLSHSGKYGLNTARSILPIPPLNLNAKKPYIAFYYEMKILKWAKYSLAIGFCTKEFALEGNALGFEKNSIGIWHKEGIRHNGYYSEFANLVEMHFQIEEVIGIGLLHSPVNSSLQCFATCNGAKLGSIYLPIDEFVGLELFPAVSMFYEGDSIQAKFDKDQWHYNPFQLVH